MVHLVATIEELKEKGIGFRSISEGVVDTTSPSGELVFNIFSALAQFERRLIQERTKAGKGGLATHQAALDQDRAQNGVIKRVAG